MSKIWLQTKTAVSKAIVLVLLCVGVILFYAISQSQQLGFYLQDAKYQTLNRTELFQPENQVSQYNILEYINSTVSTALYRKTVTLSIRQRQRSFTEAISKINMIELIEQNRKKNKTSYENDTAIDARDRIIMPKYTLGINYPPLQRERIERIRDICNNRDFLRSYMYDIQNSSTYYYSSNYNFSYCKVPKSGSTFWTQAFAILEHEVVVAERVFGKKRSKVHAGMHKYTVKFNSEMRKNSLSIIVSRDPYSRLYSAYIDKIFLCLEFATNLKIRRWRPNLSQYKKCPVDITFQEFLDFVLHQANTSRSLNRHWTPIYNLCRPCDVNAYILVKQESFSTDVKDALQTFNVDKDKLDVIKSALKEHRVEATIPGIIATVYDKISKYRKGSLCMDGKKISLRLWKSFQIQGYIKTDLQFPRKEFSSDRKYNKNFVTYIILKTIEENKMTSSEMRMQRRKALVKAYKQIRHETIDGIKELFKIDFEMFDYLSESPTVDK